VNDFLVVRAEKSMALDLLKFCFENRGHLENYVDWAIEARYWGIYEFEALLTSFETEPLPSETVFIYYKGKIVGSGRIAQVKPLPPQIMYFVGKDWEGKGLATAIARKLLEQAFEVRKYPAVRALVDVSNLASQRVLEKVGGIKVGEVHGKPHAWKETGHRHIYEIKNPSFPQNHTQTSLVRNADLTQDLSSGLFAYLISFLPTSRN